MVSHASAKGITGDDTPSSMSSVVIQDVLRNTLGFRGVVMTAALNDSAVTGAYSPAEAAWRQYRREQTFFCCQKIIKRHMRASCKLSQMAPLPKNVSGNQCIESTA